MLISFSVENFRSIKGKQTIDMRLATKYHQGIGASNLKNNFFKTGEETAPELLKSVVIYGANASGKSNLILAAHIFPILIFSSTSWKTEGKKRSRDYKITPFDPFMLNKKSFKKPTGFEIDFIVDYKRYVYGFSYDAEKIHHEKLEFYNGKKTELIYELKLDNKNNLKENFAEHFHGKREAALSIIKNTKNNLFLCLNVNEDGNNFLNPIYDWIKIT